MQLSAGVNRARDDDRRLIGVGHETAENWLDAQGATIGMGYDDEGKLTGISDPDATYTFTYDADDRLTVVDNLGTPNMPRVILTSAYDVIDNRTSLSDNFGGTVTYAYDVAHRMLSAEMIVSGLNAKPKVEFGYDAVGRLNSLTRRDTYIGGGGSGGSSSAVINTTFAYDGANRVTSIQHKKNGSQTLASYTYTWDAANQLTREVSNDGTVDFTYDLTGQLTGVTGWRTESYSFDGTGNRTMSGYQTGTGNRLLSDGSFNYEYDNEGNLTRKTEIATGKATEYTWDYRNRLTRLQEKNAQGQVLKESNYTYDPFDKLIVRSIDPDGSGPQPATVTKTVYDGVNPYADFNGSGSLTDRYL